MRSLIIHLSVLLLASGTLAQVRTERHTTMVTPAMGKNLGIVRDIESQPIPIAVGGEPFVSIAPSMRLPEGARSHASIFLRVSADGVNWSDWTDAGHDHHAELPTDVIQGNLVFFPADVRFAQFRVRGGLIDAMPEEVSLYMVNPGVSEEADTRQKAPDFSVHTSSSYPLPSYVPRTSWGASLGLSNLSGAAPITVTHLWVHHSAGQTNSSDFAAVVRSYYTYHTGSSLGWADIGYNWLVDPRGVIYQGRAHSLNVVTGGGNPDVRGAHAPGVNGSTMGVCVIGDYTQILPTPVLPSAAAITALRNILAWKANEKGMDVLGRRNIGTNNYNIISGHRDDVASSTACPGNAFYPTLPSVRRRVHAYLNPPTVAWNRVAPEAAGQMRIGFTIHPKRSQTVYFIEYATNAEFTGSQTSPERTIPTDVNEATYFNETLTGLQAGTTYFARVIAVNSDASTVGATQSFVAGVTTGIEADAEIAGGFEILGNYPNPFNPSTTIRFTLDAGRLTRMAVYDLMGREVAVLVDGVMAPGEHSVTFDATGLTSGVYLVRMTDGLRVRTRKMLLLQ
jgi:hypothetical protein